MTSKLTDADRIALTKAVEIARRDPRERDWIDTRLERGDSYWRDVAVDCARRCQQQSLELMPWESPPCFGDIDIGTPHADQHAFELLRKLLSLGLSRFEPDPLRAIEQAEANAKKRQAV